MKCEISNSKLIKYLNQELSEAESKEIQAQINNSENCLRLFNELKETYSLADSFPKLKENPNLYLNIINKVAEISKNEPLIETHTKPVFEILRPILVAASILIAIVSGVFTGSKFIEQSNIDIVKTIDSEFYINELQLENVENYLWKN